MKSLLKKHDRQGGGLDACSSDPSPLAGGDLSYQATGWVLEFSESKLGARLVLLALSYRMNNDTGICFPSLDTIATETKMTKPGVIQAIKNLEELGELEVIRAENPVFGSVNKYKMPIFADWWKRAKQLPQKGKPYLPSERVNPIKNEGKYGLPEPEVESEIEKKEEESSPLPLQAEEKDWKKIEADNERLRQAKEDRKARKANGGRKPFVKREYVPVERSTNGSRQASEGARPERETAAERRERKSSEAFTSVLGNLDAIAKKIMQGV